MRNRRIACVDIRDFGLEVRLRALPDLRAVPAVLAATATDAAPILELNERARCRELYAGMTVAQGHARVPEMRVEIRDDHEADTVSRTIVKALQVLSPCVEEERAGLYYLEALGNGRLYKNERLFALRVIAAVNACGFPAALGVAANRSVAKIAAGICCSFRVSPGGIPTCRSNTSARTIRRNLARRVLSRVDRLNAISRTLRSCTPGA